MIAVRLTLLGILLLLALTLGARTGAGQAGIKGKPKAGALLVANPADLPKPGAVLGSMALVQRPGPLKGVRTWTIETKRHRWALLCSTASPDGKWVATGGYDGLIRIWDAETGALVRALAGHEAGVYALAWSPDGHYLASAGSYSTKVWDPTTGLAVRTLKGSKLGAGLVAWFPNGTRLVTAGAGSGQVAVFDVASSRELVAIEFGNAIVSIAVHPAGDRIAVVLNASALVIDATRLKTIYSLPNAAEGNYYSAFSPDGKLVALGSVKATRLFDVETGDFARKIDGPGYALAWTPTGGLIVVGTGNQVVAHAPATFAPGKPLPGLASWVTLSADGATLFGTYAPSITRWDVGKAESVRTFAVIESATLTTGPSTSVVVLHEGATIPTLWDAAGKRIGPLDGYVAGAYSSWSPTGKIFAVAGYDSKIRTWDPATGKPLRTLTTPKAVTALAVAMDGKIAAALADGTIAVWPATGEAILHKLTGHPSPATALAWTADGRFLASGGEKDLMTWGMDKGKRLKTIDPIRPVYGLAWTTDASKLVVASSAEVALVVYAAGTGKPISTIEKGESNLATSTLSWSPDGTILLGYRGGGIQQWNVKSGRATQAIGSPAATSTHSFMPDGRMVSVGCVDRTVRYIEAATGRLRFSAVADADHLIAVNAEGHYRPADIAEAELIAIVHTDKGQETMPLKDFAARYGFRNQPTLVK